MDLRGIIWRAHHVGGEKWPELFPEPGAAPAQLVRIYGPCPKQQISYPLFGIVNESASGGGGGPRSRKNNRPGEYNADDVRRQHGLAPESQPEPHPHFSHGSNCRSRTS